MPFSTEEFDDFDRQKLAIIVEISENVGFEQLGAGDGGVGFSHASRETTPSTAHGKRRVLLQCPAVIGNGFWFGTVDGVDFQLPNPDKIISRKHFRVSVNEHRTWMIKDRSKHGTYVDRGHRIYHTQRALNPDGPNLITLRSINFLIHVCDLDKCTLLPCAKPFKSWGLREPDLDSGASQTQTWTETQTLVGTENTSRRAVLKAPAPLELSSTYHVRKILVHSETKPIKRLVEISSG